MITSLSSKKVALVVISLLGMISMAITDCDNPTPLLNGKWTSYYLKNKLEVGARWDYSCYNGYSLVGSATVICNSNNQWSSAVPTCVRGTAMQRNSRIVAAKCSKPSTIINGRWTATFMADELEVGAVWKFTCYTGYELVGSESITCNANLQWTTVVPTCTRAQATLYSTTAKCPSPRQIFNGRWTATFLRDKLEIGAVWKYTCYRGYTLVGSSTIYCSTNGQWTSDVPVCQLGSITAAPIAGAFMSSSTTGKCPYPRVIVNGKWIATYFKDQLESGAVWQFTCYNGYSLVGSASMTCKSNGQWSSEVPTCERGASGLSSSTTDTQVTTGTQSCKDMQLPAFTTGTYYYNFQPREIGTRLMLSCFSGYTLLGNSEITCKADGQWSGQLPQCIINPTTTSVSPSTTSACNDPGLPINGQRFGHYTNHYLEFGAHIIFKCNDGFKMEGADTIICGWNGQWSPSVIPSCKRDVTTTSSVAPPVVLCNDPGTPGNAQRFASYKTNFLEVGAIIIYSCNDGFLLKGANQINCNANGKWSSTMPKCELGSTTTTSVPPIITDISCSDPGIPENAQREATYTNHFLEIGATIFYTCNEGFQLEGSHTTTCNSDGTWSSPIPKCEDAKQTGCSLPPQPEHGKVQLIIPLQYPGLLPKRLLDDKIQYFCDPSYHLVGPQMRICLSDGKWSGSEPRCVRDCGRSKVNRIPYIINGEVSVEGQWPWQAGIAWDEKLLMDKQMIDSSMVTSSGGNSRGIHCGGSLINEEWVLTAAHCVTKQETTEQLPVEAISVYLGKQYRDTAKDDDFVQWSKIGDITIHEEYSPGVFKADIALIRLEIIATFSDRVVPVCLPNLHRPYPLEKREKGVVSGWGLNEEQHASDVLKYGIIEFVPASECEQLTPGLSPTSTGRVQEDQFCAKATSLDSGWTCRGDSGGPLVYIEGSKPDDQKWVIEGIVSWGKVGCAEQASVYIRVQHYIRWMSNFVDVREYSI